MRLGRHAWRIAALPVPFSGFIGTPTTCHYLCAKVLNCFGFINLRPQRVTAILQNIIVHHLQSFVAMSSINLVTTGAVVTVATVFGGIPGIVGLGLGTLLASTPTARMLVSCGCDLILILERAFRQTGNYVGENEIEAAAVDHVSESFERGRRIQSPQQAVWQDVTALIPWPTFRIGVDVMKLRTGMAEIIQRHRFQVPRMTGGSRSSESRESKRSIGSRESPRSVGSRESPRSVARRESPRGRGRREAPTPSGGSRESPRCSEISDLSQRGES